MVAVLLLRVRSRWCTINASVMQSDTSGRAGSVLSGRECDTKRGVIISRRNLHQVLIKDQKLSKECLIFVVLKLNF